MFEDATFESYGRIHTRSRNWMLATFALNGCVLAALVLFPLLHPERLERALWLSPLVFQQEPQPVHVKVTETVAREPATPIDRTLRPPVLIHSKIAMSPDLRPPDGATFVDVAGDGTFLPSDANSIFGRRGEIPVVKPTRPDTVHLSSKLVAGLLVRKTIPEYPPIAKTLHVQGTVVLQATISTAGKIEGLRVVSGPALLQRAALEAVKTWVYRPYILNGKPVEVETTVNVEFRME
ncbi:MAG TPA: energy transducer TonB [Terracidiphilus sp.]|nr:energy transducer TonB [Terracidiphilus sp.]